MGDTPQGTLEYRTIFAWHAPFRQHVRAQPGQRLAARAFPSGVRVRRALDVAFQVFALAVLCLALASLGALIWDVWRDGASRLSWDFLTGFPSRRAETAGIWHALTGSVFVILVTAALAVPVGVAAAIYLEEYGTRSVLARLIEITHEPCGRALEHLRPARPGSLRADPRLGRSVPRAAPRWRCSPCPWSSFPRARRCAPYPSRCAKGRTRSARRSADDWYQVLPVAMPGIMTGLIPALSRAIGERRP